MRWIHKHVAAIKKLHRQTTAGAKGGLAFRYVSRPLASTLLYALGNAKITPNQVTWASFGVGVTGAVLLASWRSETALLLAALALLFAHVLDALDGQLARARGQGSKLGAELDFFIDELKAYALLIGLSVRGFRLAMEPIREAATGIENPLWLLTSYLELFPARADAQGMALGLLGFSGVLALAIGLSCTRFLRLPAWKEGASAVPEKPGAKSLSRIVSPIDRLGRFLIDYPSWLPLALLLGRFDLYLLLYPLALILYALRSLAVIFWRTAIVPPRGITPSGRS